MTRACVLLAPGFEEIEAVTLIDVLRRAGVETTMLGVEGLEIEGSHGIRLAADERLAARQDEPWDLVVLPGGMPGAAHLRDRPAVQQLLRAQASRGGRLAAICAAPIALSVVGALKGRRATSYPAFAGELDCASYVDEPVVVDGPVTTSRGPGTALAFALELVASCCGEEQAQRLADTMLTARKGRAEASGPV